MHVGCRQRGQQAAVLRVGLDAAFQPLQGLALAPVFATAARHLQVIPAAGTGVGEELQHGIHAAAATRGVFE